MLPGGDFKTIPSTENSLYRLLRVGFQSVIDPEPSVVVTDSGLVLVALSTDITSPRTHPWLLECPHCESWNNHNISKWSAESMTLKFQLLKRKYSTGVLVL